MNIKLTKKRRAILDVLKRNQEALSAKEINQLLPDVDLVTVYRNLELFVAEKIITQLNFSGHDTKFEYQETPHHHAVCTECNKVIHFDVSNSELKPLLKVSDFNVDEVEVTLRGYCKHHDGQ